LFFKGQRNTRKPENTKLRKVVQVGKLKPEKKKKIWGFCQRGGTFFRERGRAPFL